MMAGDIRDLLAFQRKLNSEEKMRLGAFRGHKAERSVVDGGEAEPQESEQHHEHCDNEHQPSPNNNVQQSAETEAKTENKENHDPIIPEVDHPGPVLQSSSQDKNIPLSERHLSSNEGCVEEQKRAFAHDIVNSENPLLTFRSNVKVNRMLRYGEYSPNNPQLRVTAAPYIGLGEYEQRRNLFLQRQRADYLEHLSKKGKQVKNLENFIRSENVAVSNRVTKAVQTDIQNIHSQIVVQHELQALNQAEKDLSPVFASSVMHHTRHNLPSYDQRLTSAQNALLRTDMDKPKSILSNRRTGSPRERLMPDVKHSYMPSFMDGFSYQDSRSDELERERMKRENYNHELRMQIEEKRRLQSMRDEQDRREQELENRRLEQQLLRMQEEQMIEEQRRSRRDEQMRRHSEDLLRRKHEMQSRHHGFRKHTDSESSVSSLRNTNVASTTAAKALSSHYSPPVSRRNPYSFNIPSTSVFADPTARYNPGGGRYATITGDPSSYLSRKDALNRMDSLGGGGGGYDSSPHYHHHNSSTSSSSRFNNAFGRHDSLSRIDSLSRQQHDSALNRIESLNLNDSSSLSYMQRRHSATQQDLRRSPKLQRRSSSSRFDDTLPIPVLKAHSPVAKELKNSIPFNSSRHSSDAVRKLEDKWQIPAVQRNIINHGDALRDGQGRSILTQLGAMRMQLQQEQLRMDETLRKRDFTQSKAVDFH